MNEAESLNKLLDHYETYGHIDGCEKELDRLEKAEKVYNILKGCITKYKENYSPFPVNSKSYRLVIDITEELLNYLRDFYD